MFFYSSLLISQTLPNPSISPRVQSLITYAIAYHETEKLLEECLHRGHQLPLQLDMVEWRLVALPPNCDQSKAMKSDLVILSYVLSGSHRSSQSVAIGTGALANKWLIQKVLS